MKHKNIKNLKQEKKISLLFGQSRSFYTLQVKKIIEKIYIERNIL